ncbi:MAG: LLM class F420-dependent oxidoreductase [Minwuia sp.]|uniref:LLM class F420-dependent oxidoreductase n=1 Tax=Minwuia sp. TaxID=2493630 RepID=UPI003A88BBB2
MDLGVFCYNTAYSIRPAELATLLEERGYESVWFPEHTNIPVSRESEFPGGGELPKPYYHMMDPWTSLAAAAAVTSKLKLGTGISLVIQHDPIILAKTIATLDVISNGRVLFGIGGGWNAEEMAQHGIPFKRRWKVLREKIEAIKTLWTEEEASYEGEFVNIKPTFSYPKPVQQPHPPIILGSATGQGRQRVVNYCDGWMPINVLLEDMPSAIEDLRRRAEEAGRDPNSIKLSIFAQVGVDEDLLRRYRDMGISRSVIGVPTSRPDKATEVLDRYAPLLKELAA